jgi:Rod binding domain-containing protein
MRVDGITPGEAAAQVGAVQATAAAEADPKLREVALQFEELLVRQLTQVLADTAKAAEGEDGEASVASGFYADQLPDVLASAIKDAGGLGLADELERAMRLSS